jgi:D-sedoheptulose 7-phosphate isomerase
MKWMSHICGLKDDLGSLSVRNADGRELDVDSAFMIWKSLTLEIREARRTIFLIGNGASASMASHVSADLAKNAHVRTEVFSDLSLITAIANDLSYQEVFAEPLRRRMMGGDMLVAISSSGQSLNILRATEEVGRFGGSIITLSAMKPDNPLRKRGTLNFYAPAMSYGMAETCHAAILHYWIDLLISGSPNGHPSASSG